MNISQEEQEKDPFLELGFGLIAYRDMLWTFVVIFTVLSGIVTPQLMDFSTGGAFTEPIGNEQTTIGNLGYSSSMCTSVPFEVGKMPLSCVYG